MSLNLNRVFCVDRENYLKQTSDREEFLVRLNRRIVQLTNFQIGLTNRVTQWQERYESSCQAVVFLETLPTRSIQRSTKNPKRSTWPLESRFQHSFSENERSHWNRVIFKEAGKLCRTNANRSTLFTFFNPSRLIVSAIMRNFLLPTKSECGR